MLVVQQDVDDACDRAADAVEGRALARDDLIRGAADVVVDLLPLLCRERGAARPVVPATETR